MRIAKIVHCKYELKYDYYVYSDGRIWSCFSKKFISHQLDKNGYCKVNLASKDGKRHLYSVHRLIMENFCWRNDASEMQVNHKDGNKQNNSLNNLEWATCQQNIDHAVSHGLRAKINGASKLSVDAIYEIRQRSANGESNVKLANEYHVHPDTIGRIKNRKMWKSFS